MQPQGHLLNEVGQVEVHEFPSGSNLPLAPLATARPKATLETVETGPTSAETNPTSAETAPTPAETVPTPPPATFARLRASVSTEIQTRFAQLQSRFAREPPECTSIVNENARNNDPFFPFDPEDNLQNFGQTPC
jgi:hypothetical protein